MTKWFVAAFWNEYCVEMCTMTKFGRINTNTLGKWTHFSLAWTEVPLALGNRATLNISPWKVLWESFNIFFYSSFMYNSCKKCKIILLSFKLSSWPRLFTTVYSGFWTNISVSLKICRIIIFPALASDFHICGIHLSYFV